MIMSRIAGSTEEGSKMQDVFPQGHGASDNVFARMLAIADRVTVVDGAALRDHHGRKFSVQLRRINIHNCEIPMFKLYMYFPFV